MAYPATSRSSEPTPASCFSRFYGYFALFASIATITALGFPKDYEHGSESTACPFVCQFSYVAQMLVSLATGSVVVFLYSRRASAAVTDRAFLYATLNCAQSVLASGYSIVGAYQCKYGILFDWQVHKHNRQHLMVCITFTRIWLYFLCLQVMQSLIYRQLHLLEQTSSQKLCVRTRYTSKLKCGRKCCFLLTLICAIPLFCTSLTTAGCTAPLAFAGLTWLCFILESTISIAALCKCFLELQRITRVAGREDTPVAVTLPLKRAVKFAGLQAAFLVFSLMLAILLPPAAAWVSIADTEDVAPTWVAVVIQAMHYLGNAATVLFLISAPATRTAQSPGWKAKVEELSRRGMTLRSLLRFYQEDIRCNLDWCYAPIHHKTKDVVRRVIIPVTSAEECSYAVSCMNRDGAQRAQIMVTHNWGNCFKDLLAAVISDALNECSFKLIANLLEEDCEILFDMLNQSRRLDDVYWICAFAVNQHLTICHNNPYDRDPVAQELHPVCSCSSVNISDPDGTSTVSEVNKFDDMMHHLASTGVCRQVIAVDQSLDLFMRAWCVAEIAEARRLQMNQALKLASKATIMQRARTLENVDVENMQASSEADKELILHKIRDSTGIGKFNQDLQTLIFDPNSGLLASWSAMDSYQQIGEVGRLIRWGLADAGTGKVWNAWEGPE